VRPESIRDVAAELHVLRTGQFARQLRAAAELRHRAHALGRRHDVFLPLLEGRLLQQRPPRHPRPRGLGNLGRVEHRDVGHVAIGLVGDAGELGLGIDEQRAAIEERVDAVVMVLQVALHARMVVALGALQVGAKEESADIPRHQVRLAIAIEEKLGGGAQGRLGAIRGKNLTHQLVPRLVRREGGAQVFLPLSPRHMLVGAAFHEQNVEDVLHVPRIFRAGQQPVNDLLALVGSAVRQEFPRLGCRRNGACQVQGDAAQELGIRRDGCGIRVEVGLAARNGLVDALVQRSVILRTSDRCTQ